MSRRLRTLSRCALLGAAALLGASPAATAAGSQSTAAPSAASVGASIYLRGQTPAGPVQAARQAGAAVEGATAACVNCHRRSGLGSIEGQSYVPPVTGQFLFHPKVERPEDLDLPYIVGSRVDREPYTDASLAQAIRAGIGADGKPLNYLMPRYTLDDDAMHSLIEYLRALTVARSPGVSDEAIDFATIITPDAAPARRDAMLAVLNAFFAEKNATLQSINPVLHRYRKMMYRASRRWNLHVWQLTGPPQSWGAQLRHDLAAQPVFAVLSGVGGADWTPVHRFCEQAALPCLFPNVEAPVVAEDDFHSVYFSKGVLLESALIATRLRPTDTAAEAPSRLVQIYRAGDVGAAAAKALRQSAQTLGVEVQDHALPAQGTDSTLAAALHGVRSGDELVLWLRPADIATLSSIEPPTQHIWLSGQMAGLEDAPLPPAWRKTATLTYPYDLPDKRRVRVDYPLGWFRIRHVPVTDVPLQTDTYLACGLVSELLNNLYDTFVRDYMIEQLETMLEHRVLTGYYPRLSLAQGQRFASKGGYLVHFNTSAGAQISAVSDWLTP